MGGFAEPENKAVPYSRRDFFKIILVKGPNEPGGYRGFPAKLPIEPHGLDEAVARRLWGWASEVSGISFP